MRYLTRIIHCKKPPGRLLWICHELKKLPVRPEPVEGHEAIHVSTSSTRTASYRIRAALISTLLVTTAASGAEFMLGIADIASPAFSARGIRLVLPADGSADLQIVSFKVTQREVADVRC